jgi:hypothetical protein
MGIAAFSFIRNGSTEVTAPFCSLDSGTVPTVHLPTYDQVGAEVKTHFGAWCTGEVSLDFCVSLSYHDVYSARVKVHYTCSRGLNHMGREKPATSLIET